MVCNITEIIVDSEQRREHINHLLRVEGLSKDNLKVYINNYREILESDAEKNREMIVFLDNVAKNLEETGFLELSDCCYSALALSGVKEDERDSLLEDHYMIKEAVVSAGLRNYDPSEVPFNPQHQLIGAPQDIFDTDLLMVAASRFFTFTNLAASSGSGIEERSANIYVKMPLIFMKKGNYVSRMTTGARRVVLVEYDNLATQKGEVIDVISRMREFTPGVGTCTEHGNTLVGFRNGQSVCLPGLIEKEHPNLRYDFNQYT